MRLLLMRHAHAEGGFSDDLRPLSASGRASAERMAVFLKNAGIRLGAIRHSPKLRAIETAGILQRLFGASDSQVLPGLLPDSDPETARSRLEALTREFAEGVLVVAHQPLLGDLASLLLYGQACGGLVFEPGGCMILDCDDGRWRLVGLVQPSLLGG